MGRTKFIHRSELNQIFHRCAVIVGVHHPMPLCADSLTREWFDEIAKKTQELTGVPPKGAIMTGESFAHLRVTAGQLYIESTTREMLVSDTFGRFYNGPFITVSRYVPQNTIVVF